MKQCLNINLSYTNITSKAIISLKKLEKIRCISLWSGIYCPMNYYDYIIGNDTNLKKYK